MHGSCQMYFSKGIQLVIRPSWGSEAGNYSSAIAFGAFLAQQSANGPVLHYLRAFLPV